MNLMNQIEYLKLNNLGDMFDDCSVPDGLDMQRVRGAIVMRCGLLTPIFSEPEVQRAATQQFFFENQWNFEHIIKVLLADYSPIENVAEWRNETTVNSGTDQLTIARTETETHSGTDGRTVSETGTRSGQESNNGREQSISSSSLVREISAENASTYQADNRETENGQQNKTDNNTKQFSGNDSSNSTDNFTHGHNISTTGNDSHITNKDSENKYEVFRHGNVGVTSNQDMLNQELDLIDRFNPYRFIADLYEKELILGLY